jgi:hypothetical protein
MDVSWLISAFQALVYRPRFVPDGCPDIPPVIHGEVGDYPLHPPVEGQVVDFSGKPEQLGRLPLHHGTHILELVRDTALPQVRLDIGDILANARTLRPKGDNSYLHQGHGFSLRIRQSNPGG